MTNLEVQPYFKEGEKVLCYEPDPKKMQVLYDAKILNVFKTIENNGKFYYEYKIHFQGWSSTWDRKVTADCLLKDNQENRQLQRKLAEEAQVQKSGGYSYKDRVVTNTTNKNKSKSRKITATGVPGQYSEDPLADDNQVLVQRHSATTKTASGKRLRDSSANKKPGGNQRNENRINIDDCNEAEDEIYMYQEHLYPKLQQNERVILQISERLRQYLEYDYEQIVKHGKQHILPARTSIVALMEDFIRQRTVELAITTKKEGTRSRGLQKMSEREARELDRIVCNVSVLKEVVDGIRIYFVFFIDKLLYKEERNHVMPYMADEYVDNFKCETQSSFDSSDTGYATHNTPRSDITSSSINSKEDSRARYECNLLHYISIIAANNNAIKQLPTTYATAESIKRDMRLFLQEVFDWHMFPKDSPPDKSMIFGATHLARLLIKLPEYLNVSPIANDKLELILPHLSAFINYLESREDLFTDDNYLCDHTHTQLEQLTEQDEQEKRELFNSLELKEDVNSKILNAKTNVPSAAKTAVDVAAT